MEAWKFAGGRGEADALAKRWAQPCGGGRSDRWHFLNVCPTTSKYCANQFYVQDLVQASRHFHEVVSLLQMRKEQWQRGSHSPLVA